MKSLFNRISPFFFIGLFILFPLFSFTQSDPIPDRPSPPRLVNNLSKQFPDFLNSSEQQALEQKLVSFDDSTSNQITIVIVDELNGLTAMEFATKLGDKWGVGRENTNNGVVLLIKPTQSDGGREIAIAVGKGLEGAIPDITTRHIREYEMTPYFKNGDFYTGIGNAVNALMKAAKGEYNTALKKKKSTNISFITIFVLFIVIIIILKSSRRSHYTMGRRGRFYSGWGNSSGWGGGFGGGSGGGGFGGFGGGSFGGGGSSGKW